MGQRKEKYSRSMEHRVTNLEATVFDDLLPYKLACIQKEQREADYRAQKKEDNEFIAREIARNSREMLRDFVFAAIILILVTAAICTITPIAR